LPKYDLNLGYPDLDVVPKELLADLTREIVCSNRGLQYGGDLRGVLPVREAVSGFLAGTTGDPVQPSELMITCGSLQGIDIACRSLTRPGDVVLVESPTFFFAINLLQMSHVKLVGVPMRADGVDLDRLQVVIERHSPRLMYTIPSYQNPTGVCATAENRQQLVALAQKHNFVLVEDTAYHFLHFGAPPPPMLKHYDQGNGHVITVGTFSKLVAPSLRQGWLWATPEQIDQFTNYKADASASTLTCELITEYLRRGDMDHQIAFLQDFYGRKCARMAKSLAEHFPEWVSWTIPDGGFFVWVTLPEYMSAKELRTAAQARGMDFMPGQGCFTEPVADRYLRLCFAYIGEDEIEAGVAILGSILREHAG
jgi:2-aminoadipate transaminase